MNLEMLTEQRGVPGPVEPFDLGGSEESLDRMGEHAVRHGDFYRVWSPRRRSYTYVVNHPQAIKRVPLTSHENCTRGVGMDQVSIDRPPQIEARINQRLRSDLRMRLQVRAPG